MQPYQGSMCHKFFGKRVMNPLRRKLPNETTNYDKKGIMSSMDQSTKPLARRGKNEKGWRHPHSPQPGMPTMKSLKLSILWISCARWILKGCLKRTWNIKLTQSRSQLWGTAWMTKELVISHRLHDKGWCYATLHLLDSFFLPKGGWGEAFIRSIKRNRKH